ncbi:MAG: 50S ribosomal protein L11 [Candidatus Pacebacteria bacterium]|jgi:large subunit ribosomal protein L11|nr:50S ribosomal protein L11 [Candidatus Paceibacterota bacterium]MBP9058281.1 50S ribosomal protein L11 [Candidatus Paceibacterota bacterium]
MAKKVIKQLKLQIPGGAANPAPPIGPALGQAGINIGDFVSKFNAATQEMRGDIVSTLINVYEDRSYDFVIKTPPVSSLLFKAAGVAKGSGKPNTSKAGKITKAQLKEIAERKLPDLNANDIEAAMKIVAGSARQAGIQIVD